MKPLVIGVHGFNTDGEYINDLAPYFIRAGYDYQPFIYGKAARTSFGNVIANRWRTKKVFNELAQTVINSKAQDVILVGHSHGHRLNYGVQNVCGNVRCVVAFNGALNTHEMIEDGRNVFGIQQYKRIPIRFRVPVINCYCPSDWILNWGARFRPFSKWGRFGAVENENAINVDMTPYGVKGHSDFLDHLPKLMPHVIELVNRV